MKDDLRIIGRAFFDVMPYLIWVAFLTLVATGSLPA
jgi:hypothetical protein